MARPVHKYHFIYKTTNLINGKYYYGMHSCSNLDDGYLGSGLRLGRSIKKYGRENFKREILEFCKDRNELKNRESEIVTLNEIAKIECMNLKPGGQGGLLNDIHKLNFINAGSKAGNEKLKILWNVPVWRLQQCEIRKNNWEKLILSNKITYNNFKGKHHTKETIEQMKKSHEGKHFGKNNSQFGTCWIHKETENKKIKKSELEIYISNGWLSGRKLK